SRLPRRGLTRTAHHRDGREDRDDGREPEDDAAPGRGGRRPTLAVRALRPPLPVLDDRMLIHRLTRWGSEVYPQMNTDENGESWVGFRCGRQILPHLRLSASSAENFRGFRTPGAVQK